MKHPPPLSEDLGFAYQALLLAHSKRAGFAPEIIERALKARYERLVRAESNRPSSHPRA